MLSKCANPGCFAPFLYLHDGKVFNVELEPAVAETNMYAGHPRKFERFWLCGNCARTMKLIYEHGSVLAVPLRPALGPGETLTEARIAV